MGLERRHGHALRELSNQVRELSVLREEVPVLRERARLHAQWQDIVSDRPPPRRSWSRPWPTSSRSIPATPSAWPLPPRR